MAGQTIYLKRVRYERRDSGLHVDSGILEVNPVRLRCDIIGQSATLKFEFVDTATGEVNHWNQTFRYPTSIAVGSFRDFTIIIGNELSTTNIYAATLNDFNRLMDLWDQLVAARVMDTLVVTTYDVEA